VREATEGHPRRRDVLELNGGKDIEASIKEWAAVEVTREEMEMAKGKDEPSKKARANIAAEKKAAGDNEEDPGHRADAPFRASSSMSPLLPPRECLKAINER